MHFILFCFIINNELLNNMTLTLNGQRNPIVIFGLEGSRSGLWKLELNRRRLTTVRCGGSSPPVVEQHIKRLVSRNAATMQNMGQAILLCKHSSLLQISVVQIRRGCISFYIGIYLMQMRIGIVCGNISLKRTMTLRLFPMNNITL